MWQRFSDRARRVVFHSQEEAQKFGEGHVSSEHLLLGIVCVPESTAAQIITKIGPTLAQVREETEKSMVSLESKPSVDVTLTPRAKRVFDLAYEEAQRLKSDYIGTEHILIALVREEPEKAGAVLANLGIDLDRVRQEIFDAKTPRPE